MDIVMNAGFEEFVNANARDLLAHLGEEVAADAKAACPVRTGNLRDSIASRMDGDTAVVFSDVPYAAYVEEGTRHMAAEPYFRPALYKPRGD